MITAPDRPEAAAYYFTYIEQGPDGDLLGLREAQERETVELLDGITADQSLHRYAPGKWSIRDVVNHLCDTERLFVFRAFWFARGFESPLPSFDQTVAVAAARADDRTWQSLIGEFRAVRASTRAFFESLPADAWLRRGIASDNPFTVRALAWLAVGHVAHHTRILRERYLTGQGRYPVPPRPPTPEARQHGLQQGAHPRHPPGADHQVPERLQLLPSPRVGDVARRVHQ